MNIDEKTELYLSVSERPGRFGATVYNRLFQQMGLHAVYVPRRAPATADLLLQSLRALDVRGCSISMPLKSAVIPRLDSVDEIARATHSVNTIVQRDGKLSGFNTDAHGVFEALGQASCRRTLIYGAGSVVGSLVHALRRHGADEVCLATRRPEAARDAARRWSLRPLQDSDRLAEGRFDLLINATPASVDPRSGAPLWDWMEQAETVFDLVVSPRETPLIRAARERGHPVITGVDMCKHQIVWQFERYTGRATTVEAVETCLREGFHERDRDQRRTAS